MWRHIAILISFLSISFNSSAQDNESESQEYFLIYTIDPDSYSMLLSRNDGIWNNKIGGRYSLTIFENQGLRIQTSLGAFANIYDFDSHQPLSWQLWRGNLGITNFLEFRNQSWLPKNDRLILEVGYAHESQHITDYIGYEAKFIRQNMPNFRTSYPGTTSFEYYKIRLNFRHTIERYYLNVFGRIGYKIYPNPSFIGFERLLLNSKFAEINFTKKLHKQISLFSSVYYEQIKNRYQMIGEKYRIQWRNRPLDFFTCELGLAHLNSNNQLFGLFLTYTNSNGRGIDYPIIYKGIGWALRITL